MAQHETEYAGPETPAARRKWPLVGVLWIDLAVIAVTVLGLVFLIQLAFVSINARQQGLNIGNLGEFSQAQLTRLVGPAGLFVSTLVQNLVFIAVPVLRVAVLRREPIADLGVHARQPIMLVLLGLGIGAVVIIANVVLSLIFVALGFRQNQSAQLAGFLSRGDILGQALFFALVTVVVPIGEETLFRGYIFNAIRRAGPAPYLSIAAAYIVSPLIFSLVHLGGVSQDAIGLIVPIFLVGLLLAIPMQMTGSLIPSIIAHAMNNSLSVAGLLFCVNNPGFSACPT